MKTENLSQNIERYIAMLNEQQQTKLLEFIQSLIIDQQPKSPENKKEKLLKFAGSIDKSDLKLMEEAINNDCEKIEKDEW